MALIVLTSANGSPGVTTSALGLAMAWNRPTVLVDADPTGASAVPAGYFRGGHLPTEATILDLAMSHRQGTLAEDLPRMLMPIRGTQVQFLRGPLAHTQARGLMSLWEPLAGVLRSLERNGQDVIVDAGRLGLEGFPMPLLLAADLCLLTTRSHLPALVAAKSWADTLRESFARAAAAASIGAAVIGPGTPYGPGEVAKVLQIPVVASIAWDPTSAAVLSRGTLPGKLSRLRRNRRTAPERVLSSDPSQPGDPAGLATNVSLSRSLRAAVEAIQSTVTASRQSLGPELAQESY